MNAPRQNAQRVFPCRHCGQVNVIGHQTVAQDPYTSVAEVLLYQPQISETVLMLRENFTPIYAPLRDVAGYVR